MTRIPGNHPCVPKGLRQAKTRKPVKREPVPLRGDLLPRMILWLPWPPTVGSYYRNVGGKVLISAKGRAYRKAVIAKCFCQAHVEGRLRMLVEASPPDYRMRDLDNIMKGLADSIQAAGIFANDGQIDDLRIIRMPVTKGGSVRVTLETIA